MQQIYLGMEEFSSEKCLQFVEREFMETALPSLEEYIRIPNLSRAFDKEWASNGRLEAAANHICKWVRSTGIKGIQSQVLQLLDLSPVIFTEIPGDKKHTIFFYGHYDKQPPFEGWLPGLSPTEPVRRGSKLYGRGGADDGYATYGTMLAIKALQDQGLPLPRCVMITEGDEESGSGHIHAYLQHLKTRIGHPKLVFCLDSGTLDYERLWVTTSMRGMLAANLRVEVLTEGVHSGDASGLVPSPFRIIRQLLQRIENVKNGEMHEAFQVDIPSQRYQQMHELVTLLGESAVKPMPFLPGVTRTTHNHLSSIIQRGWKAQMTVIGANELPPTLAAGNVMLPACELRISIRLPPTRDPKQAEEALIKLLTDNPPYGAKVTVSNSLKGAGFNAPIFSPNLSKSLEQASSKYYGKGMLAVSEGMSIPLLGLLREMWPEGEFIVTGVLGPESNAHGPNQFLDVEYVKKLICCMAHVLAHN